MNELNIQLSLCGEHDKPRIQKALLDLIDSPMPDAPPPPPPPTTQLPPQPASASATPTSFPSPSTPALTQSSPQQQSSQQSSQRINLLDGGAYFSAIGVDDDDDEDLELGQDDDLTQVLTQDAAAPLSTNHTDYADMEAASAVYGL